MGDYISPLLRHILQPVSSYHTGLSIKLHAQYDVLLSLLPLLRKTCIILGGSLFNWASMDSSILLQHCYNFIIRSENTQSCKIFFEITIFTEWLPFLIHCTAFYWHSDYSTSMSKKLPGKCFSLGNFSCFLWKTFLEMRQQKIYQS